MITKIYEHISRVLKSKCVDATKLMSFYREEDKCFYNSFKVRKSISNVVDLFSAMEIIAPAFEFGNLKIEWTISNAPYDTLLLEIKVYE